MKKIAFVTGASGGIGYAVCKSLAEKGFDIAAFYGSDNLSAERLKKEIELLGKKCLILSCDISSYSDTRNQCENALEFFGGVSVLVNCAGISSVKLFSDTSEREYDNIFGVNMKGIYNTCQFVVPEMVRQKYGRIINISSMWGVSGASCEVVYSASKAAVIGFTKALGKELAPCSITVNCIAPGAIDTKMNNNLTSDEKADFAESIPLGRFGTPDEIAAVVSFLSSEESSYITSQVITVDGGLI